MSLYLRLDANPSNFHTDWSPTSSTPNPKDMPSDPYDIGDGFPIFLSNTNPNDNVIGDTFPSYGTQYLRNPPGSSNNGPLDTSGVIDQLQQIVLFVLELLTNKSPGTEGDGDGHNFNRLVNTGDIDGGSDQNPPPSPHGSPVSFERNAGIDGSSAGAFSSSELMQHLQSKYGLTREQAAGFIGNFMQESNLHSNINQGGKLGAPDPSAPGYGLVQWSGERRQQFEAFAREHHLDPSTKAANLAFLDHELEGNYKSVLDRVKGAHSVEEATRIVFDDYEGPGDSSLGARIRNAYSVLA